MALHLAVDDHLVDAIDENHEAANEAANEGDHEDEEELADRIGAVATDAAFIVANQRPTDTNAINAIAMMLGTQREWNGGDCLEDIANLIGLVRQHPGDQDPAVYATRLLTDHPSN